MRKTMGVLLVGLMLLGVASTSAAVNVMGTASCGQWVSDTGVAKGQNKAWLIGYMSGLAIASEKDVLKETDAASLFLWMDNYCRANPLKSVDGGGLDLFFELIQQKGIK